MERSGADRERTNRGDEEEEKEGKEGYKRSMKKSQRNLGRWNLRE